MKKTFITLFLLCLTAATWADEQKKIALSSDNTHETVNLSYANIFVTLVNAGADDEYGKVLIEIENLDETKILALFHEAYNEKQVKKVKPSFRYDKLFGGTKGKRTIDPYSQPMNTNVYFEPSNKHSLPTFDVASGQTAVVRVPIYIAKIKGRAVDRILGKEKLTLLRKQVIELDIEVTMKPGAEYLALEQDYEKLKEEVMKATFCSNKAHRPALEKQKEPYATRIGELKGKIDAAINAHGWKPEDSGYKRYNSLKNAIDLNIVLDQRVGDCGRHNKKQGHQCSYCSLSLQQIYHKLDDLYKKIYSSSDRQGTKQKVMSQVNALYGCCTAPDCSKHASAWSKGGDYKNKIVERYNRIQGL